MINLGVLFQADVLSNYDITVLIRKIGKLNISI